MTTSFEKEFTSLATAVVRAMVSKGVDMESARNLPENERVALCLGHLVAEVERQQLFAKEYKSSEDFRLAFNQIVLDSLKG